MFCPPGVRTGFLKDLPKMMASHGSSCSEDTAAKVPRQFGEPAPWRQARFLQHR